MRVCLLLAVVLANLALAGCGGGDQTKKADVTPVTTNQAELTTREMIEAMRAIDLAKAEKRGGALLEQYQQQSKERPKDRGVQFLSYYALGDRDQAWQRINGMTYLEAEFPWPYLGRAIIYDEWGETLDKAEEDYKKFLEMVPDVPYVYLKLGNLAIRRELYDDARQAFDRAVALDPAVSDAHYGLALARWYGNDLEGAKQAMLKTGEVDPQHFQARFQLGNLLLRLGDRPGALAAYLQAAEIQPRHFESRKLAAELLEQQGDKAAAAEQYEAALGAQPGNLAIVTKLAALYRELGFGVERGRVSAGQVG